MTATTIATGGRLQQLERVVEQFRTSFVAAGHALREIRDEKLYQSGFPTFEDYCREQWGMRGAYAHRLVAAAQTVEVIRMSPIGDILPAVETQARELARLPKPEQQIAVWGRVVRHTDGDPMRITARLIRDEVAKILPASPDPQFDFVNESAQIRQWLLRRCETWPEDHRGGFWAFVSNIVEQLGEQDANGRGGGVPTSEAGPGPG